MSEPSLVPINTGKLRGAIYTFAKAGDILPMHVHSARDVHITAVMKGRFRIHGPVFGDKEYSEGAFIDWPVGMYHEFVALTDKARILNIVKN